MKRINIDNFNIKFEDSNFQYIFEKAYLYESNESYKHIFNLPNNIVVSNIKYYNLVLDNTFNKLKFDYDIPLKFSSKINYNDINFTGYLVDEFEGYVEFLICYLDEKNFL